MSNKKSLARGLLVVMVIGLMAGYVLGAQQSTSQNEEQSTQPGRQTSQVSGEQPTQQMQAQALTLARTDKLIGKSIKDTQGQSIGKIEDIVLAPGLKRVSYIALDYDGRYYAVPWSALHQGPGETYTLSINKDELTKAQAFSKDNWPAQANMQLLPQSQGATASSQQSTRSSQQATGSSQQGMAQEQQPSSQSQIEERRVSKLRGIQVKDKEGADVAKIEGFVIDLGGPSSGRMSTQARAGGTDPNQTKSTEPNQTKSSTGYGEMTPSQARQWSRDPSQLQSGQLVFTVLSLGGTWGIGEKYSLVPSNLVDIQPAKKVAMLNATKQTVESVAFSPNNFPNLSSRQYVQQIYQKFGEQPYGTALGYVPPEQQQQAGGQTGQSQTGQSGDQR